MGNAPGIRSAPQADAVVDLQLVDALFGLLYRIDLGNEDLTEELAPLEERYGEIVYAELIHVLTHLRFAPQEARQHWNKIAEHRASMQRRLGSPIDLRVAMISYFLEVDPKLQNPKIIELRVFEQTQSAVYRDELTGLYNFRMFNEHLTREVDRSRRYQAPLSLLMIDVDDFKVYNDQLGHQAGNVVLKMMGSLLTDTLRTSDIAARYGGEEFALILPSTLKADALKVAERARALVENHPFPGRLEAARRLTVSMGIASSPADATGAEELLRCADKALYVAKAQGKNQVHLHGEDRRSYRRISAALDGECCVLAAEYYPLTTLNVSERGMLFRVDRHVPIGSLVNVNLMLPEVHKEISTSGRVVRVEEDESGQYEAAIRIVDLDSEDQRVLTEYLRRVGR